MFGNCKVCAEKDRRLLSLQDEIAFLRALVHAPVDNFTHQPMTLEADGIISGHDQVIELTTRSESMAAEDAEAAEERNRLLSGEY